MKKLILSTLLIIFTFSVSTPVFAGAGSEGYCIIPPTVMTKLTNLELVDVTTKMQAAKQDGKVVVITTYTFSDGTNRSFKELLDIQDLTDSFKSHFGAELLVPKALKK